MSSPVSKKPEEKKVVKKVYKIGIRFYDEGSAMIIRKDLPALIDKTDNSVRWLYDHGYQEADIEIVGIKPDCWGDFYPTITDPMIIVKSEPTLVEKITGWVPVLDGTAKGPADTITITTVNLGTGTVVQEQVKDIFDGIPVPVDPIVEQILKTLDIPKASVTTLDQIFTPMSTEEAIKNASDCSLTSPD